MEWLNYHHLLYFWTVARHGSISRATEELYLAQPTISAQLRALEGSLGETLFTRAGRNIALTEMGQVVFRYADEIFSLGRELTDTLKGKSVGRPVRFTVGVADVLPKLIAYRLLQPALQLKDPIRVVCHEDKPDRLLAELAVHRLDLVLSDAPIGPMVKVKAFNHLLGESDVTVFGPAKLVKKYRRGFPQSLNDAPMLLPTETTSLRRSFDQWCAAQDIHPFVVGEFEDSALLNVFGQSGAGLFLAPSVIASEVRRQHRVQTVGRLKEVRERFYALSVERKLKHPAVVAISEAAQQKLFA